MAIATADNDVRCSASAASNAETLSTVLRDLGSLLDLQRLPTPEDLRLLDEKLCIVRDGKDGPRDLSLDTAIWVLRLSIRINQSEKLG